MKTLKILFTLTLLSFSSNASAYYRQTCHSQKLGWNFYCDKEIVAKNKIKKQITEPKALTLAQIATAKTKAMRKKERELLDIATHFPTKENVINYIKFNQKILDKGSYFAETAQRAIWQTPEINYSLKRPVNSIGKRTWIDQNNLKQKEAALNLSQKYGIFFFYRSDCPYCHAYSPILKDFADQYNLQVIAVSLDSGILPEWPNTKIDQGQAKKMQVTAVPATIAFDKETTEIIPIGFGALTQEELLKQIYYLTQTKAGETL